MESEVRDNLDYEEELEQVPSYTPEDELAALKSRARMMGLVVRGNPSLETMRKLVNNALNGVVEEDSNQLTKTPAMSKQAREAAIIEEATKLVRVRITCMNPSKRDIQGEIISVGNKVIGTVKKFVPFSADSHPEGYHLPNVIYQAIKERKYQGFRTVSHSNGEKTKEAVMMSEFAIEVLPPLTPEQLKDLAKVQAAKQGL
ncbi:MAG: hypothetical protein ACRCVV_22045 [Shewanella sp.]